MPDMLGLMKQAQAMQAKMQEMQAELERIEVEGQAGGGMVRGGREAVKAPGLMVLHHIPELAAEALTVDRKMRAQPRPHRGDAVPGRAIKGSSHRSAEPAPGKQRHPVEERAVIAVLALDERRLRRRRGTTQSEDLGGDRHRIWLRFRI